MVRVLVLVQYMVLDGVLVPVLVLVMNMVGDGTITHLRDISIKLVKDENKFKITLDKNPIL